MTSDDGGMEALTGAPPPLIAVAMFTPEAKDRDGEVVCFVGLHSIVEFMNEVSPAEVGRRLMSGMTLRRCD